MLRFKLSKFKQVCSSILLPRILLKNLKYSKELNYYNRALEQFSKVRKSTNSGAKDEATDKQKRIIEKCFDDKSLSASEPEAFKKMSKEVKDVENEIIFTREFYNMNHCERCETVISRLFKNETVHDTSVDNKESNLAEDAKVQASTAKQEEEKLAQKIEIVDETPHVEAHSPKLEGFNSIPKILGGKTYEMSKSTSHDEQIQLDELAKRCLGSPDSELDKIVAQELKRISQNKSQSNYDIDLVQNQCIKETGATNVCRFDRVQPVHLDKVPLLDDVARDYKEGGFIREYSTILFTKDVDESKIDTPPPLSPYEKPALPFYEYPNKENITPEDDSKMETAAIDENIQETEIIFKDDSLERNDIDQEGSQILEGEENLNPKPNINQCHKSILEPKILKTAQEDVFVRNNFIQDNIPTLNIMNSQQLFTSEAETPDMHSDSKDEPQKSSISSTFLPEGDRRTLDLPENTSISANQNPDEYFNISLPDDILTEGETVKRIFAENPVSQNIFYSALPQIELQESTNKAERVSENFLKDSHSVLEPEANQAKSVSKESSVDANLDQLICKRDMSCSENSVPLSLLLKYIQERNRLEYCRKIVSKADIKLEGNKNFSGSPGDKSKSKSDCTVKPCPTQPKPKPSASGPCKIPPCKPKKDPCAKLLPIFLSTMIRRDVPFDIVKHKNNTSQNSEVALTSLSLLSEVVLQRIQKLSVQLKFHGNNNCGDAVKYARGFQPWIPIPSWPIPKKEKKRPFVCPKEGCKVPLPQPNKPCKDKQCFGLSKQSFVSRFFAP